MPPFRSTSHARWEILAAGCAAPALLALAAGCGSVSSSTDGTAAGAAAAPAAGSAAATDPATDPAVDTPTDAPTDAPTGAGTAGRADGRAPAIPQVTTVVKRFYQRYATDPAGAGERYLTAELAARVKAGGARAVFCAPKAPASLTYSASAVGDGTATVTVTTRQQGAPIRRIAVTVTVPDILVSAITCPAS